MNQKPVSNPPVPDRWSYLWLAIGAILLILSTGQFRLAFAAWVAPVFLIRFFRSQRVGKGYWITLLVLYVSLAISWRAVLEFIGPLPVFLIFNIMITLAGSLPYLADRLLAPRVQGFTATLVFPLAVTTQFYLYNLISPIGSFGTTGYEQYNNLALIQLVSVTGIWGLTLLVSWFGPVVNWAWEQSFNWPQIRRGLAVWAGVVTAVLIFGGLRLAFAQPPAGTVRIHSFSPEREQLSEIPDMETDPDGFRRAMQMRNEVLIAGTLREARGGAQIVLWPETAGGGVAEDANALIARVQEVAKQEGIYVAMGLEIHFPEQQRPWENKLIVIDPSGEIIINHDKFGATFFYNMKGYGEALQGEFALQTADTPFGTLTGVVCWDADFPMTMKQAGKERADILLVPIGDPPGSMAVLHAQQHVFRAIENGVSLVRHEWDEALSVAADPYGRILAMVDIGAASEPVMVVQVSTQGVFTLYPVIGDLFGWLSVVAFVVIAGWAIFKRRRQDA
jgi:apolipoprotein N-acyltransferase